MKNPMKNTKNKPFFRKKRKDHAKKEGPGTEDISSIVDNVTLENDTVDPDNIDTDAMDVDVDNENEVDGDSQDNQDDIAEDQMDELHETNDTGVVYEKCRINDFSYDCRFSELPIDQQVVLGLYEKGYHQATRYQQCLLHHLMLGANWWICANLNSNRGVSIGAYLVDVALSKPNVTSVIVCSAVSKIRAVLSMDIADVAAFTDIKVLGITDECVIGSLEVDVIPNIVVASTSQLLALAEKIDFSEVAIVYCDEAEKAIRDNPTQFVEMMQLPKSAQMVVQTSYFAPDIWHVLQQVDATILPSVFTVEESTAESLQVYNIDCTPTVPNILFVVQMVEMYDSFGIVVADTQEDVEMFGLALVQQGWDVDILSSTSHVKQKERCIRRMKEGDLQILVCTKEMYLDIIGIAIPTVIVTKPSLMSESEVQGWMKVSKNTLYVLAYAEKHILDIPVVSKELSPADMVVSSQFAYVQQVLRKYAERRGASMLEMVQRLSSTEEGMTLLGVALGHVLQHERKEKISIVNEIQRLERKDIYIRSKKTFKKPMGRSGKYPPRKRNG